ncbi:MAG: ABC transporter substrate-binding protein [Planctomycetota bacterium]|jgi:peptide/nickel transport system substrate-binding protein
MIENLMKNLGKLLCLGVLVAACSKKDGADAVDLSKLLGRAPSASTAEQGGTFVWGRGADSVSLDPANVSDGESVKVVTNIFDTLVTFKPGTTEIIPWVARSWETNDDQLVWTFELREDVTFHDGTPLNAEAVVFTFMRQKDEKHAARKATDDFSYFHSNFKALESVEATSEFVVRFKLKQPYAPFLAALTLHNCCIVSPAAFQTGKDFSRNPVGSGPFVFQSWESDVSITLAANDKYWNGRPPLDQLIFKPIENNSARLKELQGGGLSGMDNPALTDLAKAQSDKRVRLLYRPGINVCYMAMNTLKAPFDDPRVRQAIAYAIDKRRLIQAANDGIGEPAVTMCPRSLAGFNGKIVDRSPNPGRAKELLEEAGFDTSREINLWHMANPRAYIPNPSGIAIQIQQDLKEIGIKVKVTKMDWASYLPKVQGGEHEMCLFGWMADIFDADNFLYVLLDKENAVKGKADNVSFYQSERVHKLLLKAQQSPSWDVRERLYHQVQIIVFEECPVIPLMTLPDFRVVGANVRGYTIYPAGGEYFRLASLAK